MKMYACKCCGYINIADTYDICTICRWEADPAQEDYPDSDFGANRVSLRQAQKNFMSFGACDEASLKDASRPDGEVERDPNWKPVR